MIVPITMPELYKNFLDRNPDVVAQINEAAEHPERSLPASEVFGTIPE